MPSTSARQNVAKIVMIVCGIAFFASFAFTISFFFRDLPNRPQPELGRTYPLNNHGYHVYLTRREHLEQEVSWYVGFSLFLLMLVISRVFRPFKEQEQMTEEWRKGEQRRLSPWNHHWRP